MENLSPSSQQSLKSIPTFKTLLDPETKTKINESEEGPNDENQPTSQQINLYPHPIRRSSRVIKKRNYEQIMKNKEKIEEKRRISKPKKKIAIMTENKPKIRETRNENLSKFMRKHGMFKRMKLGERQEIIGEESPEYPIEVEGGKKVVEDMYECFIPPQPITRTTLTYSKFILAAQMNNSLINNNAANTNNISSITTNANNTEGRSSELEIIRNNSELGVTTGSEETFDHITSLPINNTLSKNIAISYGEHIKPKMNTYINCDLRYFNLRSLVDKNGFDIVLIDPPWKANGTEWNNISMISSNYDNTEDYNSLSNREILSLRVEDLASKGFCFLWILNNQVNVGYECLNKWGYDIVDQITWIKTKEMNKIITKEEGNFFLHSTEICLVGYKSPPKSYLEFNSKISNNLIFEEVFKPYQKPLQLYTMIELMMPGAKKIELFARNNNLREGWLSLGNQLGANYDSWECQVNCDKCNHKIEKGNYRYKSKQQANFDICADCFQRQHLEDDTNISIRNIENFHPNITTNIRKVEVEDEYKESDKFFCFKNINDSELFHEYYKCEKCGTEPIWGIKFQCKDCVDYNLCEICYDLWLEQKLATQKKTSIPSFHSTSHDFSAIQIPNKHKVTFPVHNSKCGICHQEPIIGPAFTCTECNNLAFCQFCHFEYGGSNRLKEKGHLGTHGIRMQFTPRENANKQIKWQE